MTDYAPLDAAVAKIRPANPNIAACFDEVEKILRTVAAPSVPPPAPAGSKLLWAPPQLTNPVTIDYHFDVVQVLDDTKDYIVRPFNLTGTASKTSGRTEGGFKGGRHIVMIGGHLSLPNTNNLDDACPLEIQAGDPNGVVHIEGVDIATVNAITVRTGRTVRVQNSRLAAQTFQNDQSHVHPDLIQIWKNLGAGSPKVQMHRVSGRSGRTFLSCLEAPDPTSWEVHQVDLHSVIGHGDFIYPCSGGQPHTVCKWTIADWWVEMNPAYPAKLDDHVGYFDWNTYTLTSADGTWTWASAVNQVGGSGSKTTIGGSQGDVWKCVEPGAGLYGQECRYGVPPGGDFCPAGVPGPAYVSPGYA